PRSAAVAATPPPPRDPARDPGRNPPPDPGPPSGRSPGRGAIHDTRPTLVACALPAASVGSTSPRVTPGPRPASPSPPVPPTPPVRKAAHVRVRRLHP